MVCGLRWGIPEMYLRVEDLENVERRMNQDLLCPWSSIEKAGAC